MNRLNTSSSEYVRHARPPSVRNKQKFPCRRPIKLKKLVRKVKLRLGSLKCRRDDGKGTGVEEDDEKRKIGILCVQETRWKSSRAKEIGEDISYGTVERVHGEME